MDQEKVANLVTSITSKSIADNVTKDLNLLQSKVSLHEVDADIHPEQAHHWQFIDAALRDHLSSEDDDTLVELTSAYDATEGIVDSTKGRSESRGDFIETDLAIRGKQDQTHDDLSKIIEDDDFEKDVERSEKDESDSSDEKELNPYSGLTTAGPIKNAGCHSRICRVIDPGIMKEVEETEMNRSQTQRVEKNSPAKAEWYKTFTLTSRPSQHLKPSATLPPDFLTRRSRPSFSSVQKSATAALRKTRAIIRTTTNIFRSEKAEEPTYYTCQETDQLDTCSVLSTSNQTSPLEQSIEPEECQQEEELAKKNPRKLFNFSALRKLTERSKKSCNEKDESV